MESSSVRLNTMPPPCTQLQSHNESYFKSPTSTPCKVDRELYDEEDSNVGSHNGGIDSQLTV